MAAPYAEFLQTHPFRFLVGPEEVPFFIHPDLIPKHSAPLDTLVNGAMRESVQSCAFLKDIDPGTFGRFAEYVYTGTYQPIQPVTGTTAKDSGATIANTKLDDLEEDLASLLRQVSGGIASQGEANGIIFKCRVLRDRLNWMEKEGKRSLFTSRDAGDLEQPTLEKSQMAWDNFVKLVHEAPATAAPFLPKSNTEPKEEHAEVLLAHARMYVFADRYCIKGLEELALHYLYQSLKGFNLFAERTDDVVELLRYTYQNTPDEQAQGGHVDQLRVLVRTFVACYLKDLVHTETFKELINEPGSLSVDLLTESMKMW